MSDQLTHLDAQGRARMVDVGAKAITERMCVARAKVKMAAATIERIAAGAFPKGDVLAVARLAGIQAAKRTADWIPLAHPIALDALEIDLRIDAAQSCVRVQAVARAQARTGVEMEALVGVTAASLALYDMCKAVDRGITIEAVRLVEKQGGKSGHWVRPGESD
jgi:cyclic pyranopterin monophosphate synthase